MSCFLWDVQAAIFKMASQLPMGPVPSAGEFACIASEQVGWNDLTTEWTTEAIYNEGQWKNPISKKSAITFVRRSCFHTLSGFLEQCGVVTLFAVASLSELPSKPFFYKFVSFVDNCNSYASKTSCRTSLLYLTDHRCLVEDGAFYCLHVRKPRHEEANWPSSTSPQLHRIGFPGRLRSFIHLLFQRRSSCSSTCLIIDPSRQRGDGQCHFKLASISLKPIFHQIIIFNCWNSRKIKLLFSKCELWRRNSKHGLGA